MDGIWIGDAARQVIDRLEQAGYGAWIVGGCVRDMLRGVAPHDWDIAAAATPEEIEAALADYRLVLTGIRHGTVTAIVDGEPIEVTACRGEGEYLDGRHPESVTFHRSIEEDLARRDFTINALAYSPYRGFLDLYGGREDLAAGVIRCIRDPGERFREDALRILRGLRFAATLGYEIEGKTSAAIHELAETLQKISIERCTAEFSRLILGKKASEILTEFADVIEVFLPEAKPMMGFVHREEHHGDLWKHSARSLAAAPQDLPIRLALLLRDCAKPLETLVGDNYPGHAARGAELAHQALTRLRLPNTVIQRASLLVRHHSKLPEPEDRSVLQAMRTISPEALLDLCAMRRADRQTHEEDCREIDVLEERIRELLSDGRCYQLSQLALSGGDLIPLGYRGPEIGRTLERLLSAVINGDCPNEKEALLHFLKV